MNLRDMKIGQTVVIVKDSVVAESGAKFNANLRMVDVTNSLNTIDSILKTLDEPDLARKVEHTATEFRKISGYDIDQDTVYRILKAAKINDLFRSIAARFKKALEAKEGIKYGRKSVDLTKVLEEFRKSFQEMLKDLADQGFDTTKIR